MALYKIHRFLQRRAYFQRFTTWIQRQRSAMQLTYQTSRRSIQTVRHTCDGVVGVMDVRLSTGIVCNTLAASCVGVLGTVSLRRLGVVWQLYILLGVTILKREPPTATQRK